MNWSDASLSRTRVTKKEAKWYYSEWEGCHILYSYFIFFFTFSLVRFINLGFQFVQITAHGREFTDPFNCTQQFLTVYSKPFMCLNPVVQPNFSLPSLECLTCKPLCIYTIYTTTAQLMTWGIQHTWYCLYSFDVKINPGRHVEQLEEDLWKYDKCKLLTVYKEFTMIFCLILIKVKLCTLCLLYQIWHLV